MPASPSASRIARTWFVGRQYQSMAARGATSVELSGPCSRIRSSSSSTSGACSSKAPSACAARLRSHVIRYHGSSAVGTSESILLNVSYRTRSRYSRSSVQARR